MTQSWIIIENSTGRAVFETFNCIVKEAINTTNYTALTVQDYLGQLNARIKEGLV